MVAVLAVADFRNSESWNQARLAVCTILEFSESWSSQFEYRTLAKKIQRLSIAVLDNIAKGCEGTGNEAFLSKAAQTIDRLEQELYTIEQEGMLQNDDSSLLKRNLDAVKESFKHLEQ